MDAYGDRAQRLPTPYRPEADVVADVLSYLAGNQNGPALDWDAAAQVARPWVVAVRAHPPPFWALERLLQEFPLSSAEGLALMRLAEALLRVPDLDTAMALTADQLHRADLEGHDNPALAGLTASVMALSTRLLPEPGGIGDETVSGRLSRLAGATVVAGALRATQLLGRQFVLGQTIAAAMDLAAEAKKSQHGLRYSYDMLGEGARTDADALRYLASYSNAIESIANEADKLGVTEKNDGISIKLSALHPRYEDAQHTRVMAELVPRVWGLCTLAARAHINLTIDAEEVDRLELSLDVLEALAVRVAQQCPQWQGLGLAIQAYQTRSLALVQHVIGIARSYRLRLMCRLVKGAYWDTEIKRAQELGLPHYPVFTRKHHTDVSYLACAKALLGAPDAVYPQFAGHNAGTIAAILQMAARHAAPFELQRLHGMGEGIFREVLKNSAVSCRVYAPVGAHRDLLAYLVRRLLENGANASFVHQLADESVGMGELLTSPLQASLQPACGGKSELLLPLPPELYGPGRRNSLGLDLTVSSMRAPLLAAFESQRLPHVPEFDAKTVASAVDTGVKCYKKWSKLAVAERAAILRRVADSLEQHRPRFCALLVREAGKTWLDAVAEVREAVDFLRYYANEAERIMAPLSLPVALPGQFLGITGETNTLRLVPRGLWVCISPWNFPLAIFMGQVAAALVTGNAVLAKPAEQTPGVAWEAVQLLHAAGVPEGALQLLHGPGETVGAALVAAPQVAGVVFTGSTQVAKAIQRALAAKDGAIVPLIAETGGINAMLVDSSALPEQVVDAVLQSAFRSAGQRCSALRLLYVHESIADPVIDMILGAAAELTLGDPSQLVTDVGPLIDRQAFATVQRQLDRLINDKKVLRVHTIGCRMTADAGGLQAARLMAPVVLEVRSPAEVTEEIFGPVLQVVRWGSGELKTLDAVMAQLNDLGYGLTMGIQTRIDSRAEALAAAARVGNVYVNRSMIGAVVGVQAFGGQGLSGTGPQAGGPHYLYRFCTEQTVTVNTTAAGGDVGLLSPSASPPGSAGA